LQSLIRNIYIFSVYGCFNEAFRHITGMTPSEYLEKNSETAKCEAIMNTRKK